MEMRTHLHKTVNDATLSMEVKEVFHGLIDSYFIDFNTLSEKQVQNIKLNFNLASSKCGLWKTQYDAKTGEFYKIKDMIDNSFFVLLENSADNRSWWEKVSIQLHDFLNFKLQ